MKLVLICSFISGALSWTVDLEKIEIFLSDVNGRNNVASPNLASAKELNQVYEDTEYARNYEYNQDYIIENEMTDIVQNGSQFLEMINKTFSEYKDVLKMCSNKNETRDGAPKSEKKESPSNICVAVVRDSGDIRHLITALFRATRDMRDKVDQNTKVEEELEALVRVAWLLDRLARLTDLTRQARPTDLTRLAPPATAAEGKDSSTSHVTPTTKQRMEESSEILEQAENRSGGSGGPGIRRLRLRRRSATHPLQELTNYYIKYKSWTNSNAPATENYDGDFDVDNHLAESAGKRSSQ